MIVSVQKHKYVAMWTESRKLPLLLLSQPSGQVSTGLKMVLNLSLNLLQVF